MTTLYGIQRIQQITSPANPLLKEVKKAISRGGLAANGCCIAEGFHLLEEALRSRLEIDAVLASTAALRRLPSLPGQLRLIELPEELFASVASTETTQGVLALVRLPAWEEADLLHAPALVVVLDGLQDPGNAGAIVRAAEAFGATGVVFSRGSARPEHPKTLRASAGSLFRVPFLHADTWHRDGLRTYVAMPNGGAAVPVASADLGQPCAIVIGSEGQGISAPYQHLEPIAIPTSGVESLNAAMAAGILLYEAQRQRGSRAK